MVESLRRAVESQRGPGRVGGEESVGAQRILGAAEIEARHGGEIRGELRGVDNPRQCLLVGGSGVCRRFRESLGGDGLHALQQMAGIAHRQERTRGDETQHRDPHGVVATRGHVGGHCHALHLLFGELRLDVESSDGVHLVAEEVYAVRELVGIAEHVDDGASHGELPRLIDVVLAGETVVEHPFDEAVEAQLLPHGDLHGVVAHLLARRHPLGHGFGIGHHETERGVVVPVREGLGAEHLRGGILLAIFYVALIARGEEHHLPLAAEGAEVLIEITGIVGIVGDHSDGGACRTGERREGHGRGRTRHACGGHRHGGVLQSLVHQRTKPAFAGIGNVQFL